MDDAGFMALAEGAVRYVDEKWGRPVACMVALTAVALPIGIVAFLFLR